MTRLVALVLVMIIAGTSVSGTVDAQSEVDERAAAETAVELSWYESVEVCASDTTASIVDGIGDRRDGSLNAAHPHPGGDRRGLS